MTAIGSDSLGTRDRLTVNGETFAYYSLPKVAAKFGDVSRLPFSLKVLLENLLRFEDDASVTVDDIRALVDWQKDRRSDREIQYRPARVLMPDFTAVLCIRIPLFLPTMIMVVRGRELLVCNIEADTRNATLRYERLLVVVAVTADEP